MVRLLGEEGDARHEAERLDKVLELELLGNGVPTASGELPRSCVCESRGFMPSLANGVERDLADLITCLKQRLQKLGTFRIVEKTNFGGLDIGTSSECPDAEIRKMVDLAP